MGAVFWNGGFSLIPFEEVDPADINLSDLCKDTSGTVTWNVPKAYFPEDHTMALVIKTSLGAVCVTFYAGSGSSHYGTCCMSGSGVHNSFAFNMPSASGDNWVLSKSTAIQLGTAAKAYLADLT